MKALKSRFGRTTAPWRDFPSDEKDSYLDYIKKFQLNKEGVEHIRVMLYGLTGAGKSSFINSVERVIRGRMTSQALADGIGNKSFTTKYYTHRIKKDYCNHYPFVFSDLMGLERDLNNGICYKDIELAMKGHVRDGYEFNPQSPISSTDRYYNSSPSPSDRTHVLVCVVSANSLNLLSPEHMYKIRDVRLAARNLGIPQIAILTKIDEACPKVNSNIKKVYKSPIIKKRTEELSGSVGFPQNCIFPVKNYHSEITENEDMDALLLMALKIIIDFGEDFVDNISNLSFC